jgi:lysophospholipase L1-like esterase
MERSTKGSRLIVGRLCLGALGLAAVLIQGAWAQAPSAKPESTPEPSAVAPEASAVAKDCGEPKVAVTPLPNSALALQKHQKIKILAIGSSAAAVLGMMHDGIPPLLEQILERNIKGLDVEIINRGFSGELAEAASERLKLEVALNEPNLVLWQVGANDAFAQVPVESFERSVVGTVRWLKEHNVDVILVGLHYMKQLAKNEHYQAIRTSLQRITAAESVQRVTRYEAMEVLARTLRESGRPEPRDFGLTEDGYNCMAQYVARAITVGLFAKPAKHAPQPAPTR